jgi:hypothetical protein
MLTHKGTRWRATPNAHQPKDQTFKISEKREGITSPEWLIFTAVKWLSSSALQTPVRRESTDRLWLLVA